MFLLDININEALNKILVSAESSLKGSLDPVFTTIYEASGAYVAIGVLLTIMAITMQMMIGGNLSIDKFAKMMIFYLLFANCKEILEVLDLLFQLPANALDKILHNRIEANGNTLVDAYKNAVIKNIDDSHTLSSINPAAAYDKMFVYIGYTVSLICSILYELALFLIKFVSILGARILIAFAPISFAVSLLPGFEGSMVGLIKYIFVIRLWAAIGTGLKLAFYGVGLLNVFEQQRGMIDSGVGTNWDWSICALQLVFLLCTVMIPMFADALISGSQSGGFFSASVGWGLNKASSMTKDAASTVGAGYKGFTQGLGLLNGGGGGASGISGMNNGGAAGSTSNKGNITGAAGSGSKTNGAGGTTSSSEKDYSGLTEKAAHGLSYWLLNKLNK